MQLLKFSFADPPQMMERRSFSLRKTKTTQSHGDSIETGRGTGICFNQCVSFLVLLKPGFKPREVYSVTILQSGSLKAKHQDPLCGLERPYFFLVSAIPSNLGAL